MDPNEKKPSAEAEAAPRDHKASPGRPSAGGERSRRARRRRSGARPGQPSRTQDRPAEGGAKRQPRPAQAAEAGAGAKAPRADRPSRRRPDDRRRPAQGAARVRAEGPETARPAEAAPADRAPSPVRGERPAPDLTAAPPDLNLLLVGDRREGEPEAEPADPAEVERILSEDFFDRPTGTEIPAVIPEGKVVVIGVRFRGGGRTYFFDPCGAALKVGDGVIVETVRGMEFGTVFLGARLVDASATVTPLRPILRAATPEDAAHDADNLEREGEAFRVATEKIAARKLDMKLIAARYTFDNSKLLFYFASPGRVDFRELVRDLAGVFHVRIELRQVGVREEARMVGGLGPCGRPLCCNMFLSDCGQVSMKMAKEQGLSLNSLKISGRCGRLLCCLRYEYDTYLRETAALPSVGTLVSTKDGDGTVTEVFPLTGEVRVSFGRQADTPPKRYPADGVTPIDRSARRAETDRPAADPEAAEQPGPDEPDRQP